MKTQLELYRKFEKELLKCRFENGVGNEKEQPIIDNMEQVWYTLSENERVALDSEPPHFPTETFGKYKKLESDLLQYRIDHPIFKNDKTEEVLTEQLTELWYDLSEDEKDFFITKQKERVRKVDKIEKFQ